MVSLDIGMQTLLVLQNQLYLDYQIHIRKKEHFHSSKKKRDGILALYFIHTHIISSILALGLNEFYNLSYVDPSTQQTITCSEDCRLSNDTYQDFTVLDALSANGIRININSWFGSGGGLGYVQIFQSGKTIKNRQQHVNSFFNISLSE